MTIDKSGVSATFQDACTEARIVVSLCQSATRPAWNKNIAVLQARVSRGHEGFGVCTPRRNAGQLNSPAKIPRAISNMRPLHSALLQLWCSHEREVPFLPILGCARGSCGVDLVCPGIHRAGAACAKLGSNYARQAVWRALEITDPAAAVNS